MPLRCRVGEWSTHIVQRWPSSVELIRGAPRVQRSDNNRRRTSDCNLLRQSAPFDVQRIRPPCICLSKRLPTIFCPLLFVVISRVSFLTRLLTSDKIALLHSPFSSEFMASVTETSAAAAKTSSSRSSLIISTGTSSTASTDRSVWYCFFGRPQTPVRRILGLPGPRATGTSAWGCSTASCGTLTASSSSRGNSSGLNSINLMGARLSGVFEQVDPYVAVGG